MKQSDDHDSLFRMLLTLAVVGAMTFGCSKPDSSDALAAASFAAQEGAIQEMRAIATSEDLFRLDCGQYATNLSDLAKPRSSGQAPYLALDQVQRVNALYEFSVTAGGDTVPPTGSCNGVSQVSSGYVVLASPKPTQTAEKVYLAINGDGDVYEGPEPIRIHATGAAEPPAKKR